VERIKVANVLGDALAQIDGPGSQLPLSRDDNRMNSLSLLFFEDKMMNDHNVRELFLFDIGSGVDHSTEAAPPPPPYSLPFPPPTLGAESREYIQRNEKPNTPSRRMPLSLRPKTPTRQSQTKPLGNVRKMMGA
jgi:hypothetical protein